MASGVCSPSRAAVLTGHFPARHFAHGHIATVSSHAQRAMQDWPLHAIRDGRWKLLVGRQPRQVELFRFPEDRLERTDVSAEYPQVVQALNAKIEAWLAGLPPMADGQCFSVQRSAPETSRR